MLIMTYADVWDSEIEFCGAARRSCGGSLGSWAKFGLLAKPSILPVETSQN